MHDWMQCSSCGASYESGSYRCTQCGGHYDLAHSLNYSPQGSWIRGILRYQSSFPLPPKAWMPSLGEGNTPLIPAHVKGREVFFKCEFANPTGSFKDRGSAVLVASMAAEGMHAAVEDSSGNAGASFAAYAARAGIRASIFLPDDASGPKRAQIEAYGAEVIRILGPRSEASRAAIRAAEEGRFYASHAYLPHGLTGMATLAFELVEQLGRAPDVVVMPVGQGTLLLGAYRGFMAMLEAGAIARLPKLIGVQALQCAPLWAVRQSGASGLAWSTEGETIAEGIRISHPIRGDQVLQAVEATGGAIMAVDEGAIEMGVGELARIGFWVEPTSAVVWPALAAHEGEIVVAVLTGSGLKTNAQHEPATELAAEG